MADGEQFVMIIGTSTMLVSPADSSVFQMLRLLTRVIVFGMELDRFGLTMLIVEVMSHRYFHALIMDGEDTTVAMVKTRGYVVKILEVRMSDKKLNVFTIVTFINNGQRNCRFNLLQC